MEKEREKQKETLQDDQALKFLSLCSFVFGSHRYLLLIKVPAVASLSSLLNSTSSSLTRTNLSHSH